MPTPENDHRCADMTGVPACHYHAVHAPQEPHTGASRLRTREPTHGAHDAASRPVARLHRRPGASVPHARAYGSVLQHCTTTAALYVCALHGSQVAGRAHTALADSAARIAHSCSIDQNRKPRLHIDLRALGTILAGSATLSWDAEHGAADSTRGYRRWRCGLAIHWHQGSGTSGETALATLTAVVWHARTTTAGDKAGGLSLA